MSVHLWPQLCRHAHILHRGTIVLTYLCIKSYLAKLSSKHISFFVLVHTHTHTHTLQIEFQDNIMCTDMVNIRNHYKHSASFVHQSLVPPKQPPSLLPTLILLHTAAALGSAVSSFSFKSGSFFSSCLKIHISWTTLFTLSPHLSPQKTNNKFHKRELITEIILHK